MTTQFIGIKEFRQHMAKVSADARRRKCRLIILRKNKPVFAVTPLSEKDVFEQDLLRRVEKAERDLQAGRTLSTKELQKRLGLR